MRIQAPFSFPSQYFLIQIRGFSEFRIVDGKSFAAPDVILAKALTSHLDCRSYAALVFVENLKMTVYLRIFLRTVNASGSS